MAAGVAGLFMETHPKPNEALSDGPNSWPLHMMKPLLKQLKDIDAAIKNAGTWLEQDVLAKEMECLV
jgi:2-dehydro-3-deoxyphosphooctonate aldolase (KDO 8-P synthase)